MSLRNAAATIRSAASGSKVIDGRESVLRLFAFEALRRFGCGLLMRVT